MAYSMLDIMGTRPDFIKDEEIVKYLSKYGKDANDVISYFKDHINICPQCHYAQIAASIDSFMIFDFFNEIKFKKSQFKFPS
jgi:hypothetical protein